MARKGSRTVFSSFSFSRAPSIADSSPDIELSRPRLEINTVSAMRRTLPPRVPAPSYRHAAPCGPWPWVDLESEVREDAITPVIRHRISSDRTATTSGGPWSSYPQSLYPNWSPDQLRRSGILSAMVDLGGVGGVGECVVYYVDVSEKDGTFSIPRKTMVGKTDEEKEMFWEAINRERPKDIRVRALFVENLSGAAMQMIGTRYNIEPFFFSSSLNWIPSRYAEDIRPAQGDHITITLTFLRVMQNPIKRSETSPNVHPLIVEQIIDTQGPLVLRSSGKVLFHDLLSVHLVRSSIPGQSTIISYHPAEKWCTTSAKFLHDRVRYAGQSVFWQNIFKNTSDPTFVLLTILWHALYAWDEAMEELYDHICWLESRVIHTSDMGFSQELYIISAHLVHYVSLLDDFRKSITFIIDTPNPMLDSPDHDQDDSTRCKETLQRECHNVLSEISRLDGTVKMQTKRLQNVMDLVFSTVNIEDSRQMKHLTEATVRDSAAMKQISYLTMIFLPASFCASVFGMNIKELVSGTNGTVGYYFATVVPLTILTCWIIIALRSRNPIDDGSEDQVQHEEVGVWTRLWWPLMTCQGMVKRWRTNRKINKKVEDIKRGKVESIA